MQFDKMQKISVSILTLFMLTAISDLFAIQKVRNPADLHLVPENFRTLSIQELMNERVQYLCTHSDPKIEDLRESVW